MIDASRYNYEYQKLEDAMSDNQIAGEKKGLMYFNNYEELINTASVDLLFVCVPNYLSPIVTIAGLKKGMHVFCEKPPGRNVDDIKNVIDIERKNPHLKLKYGFNHRYHQSVMETKQIIDSNKFGEIINIRGVYGKSSIVPFTGQWRSLKKYAGGGILLDQGIHMLDMFRYFCGDFDEVKSFVSNNYWGHDVEDNAYALMRDSRGRVAIIHSSATQWQHSFRLELTLEKGFIELSGILSGSKSYGQEKLMIVSKLEGSVVGSLSQHETTFLEDKSWELEIAEFVDCVVKDTPVIHGKSNDALKLMELIYDIYSSDDSFKT